ncbi:GntR family transcriptional regulator [Parapedobacter pyrenivorans]|uniref:GntR family transcriptional regulator n=1 Tax=Parapedobacter pyrenivorans TaxID=1305674 RepID=A0A917I397_9SPHI|nr:GntR family transcriptional regulator [Parapedobacter pyrenivorans]GGH03889.1 GntR family transcriptional regulator [Parapedobacter pyrenivorans]
MKEESLSNRVYTEIRGKIISNQLVPGTRLKEDAWAKKQDVSRVAVREALNRLFGENLVEKGERGGYFVKSMNTDDIREIRELREVLELGALQLACEKLEDNDIRELEKICDDFSNMVKSGYFGGACEADVKFHETLIGSARNQKLKNIYISSNIPLFHFKLGRASSHMDDYEQTDKEHRKIVAALKSKDFEQAKKILVGHLHRGELESLDEG